LADRLKDGVHEPGDELRTLMGLRLQALARLGLVAGQLHREHGQQRHHDHCPGHECGKPLLTLH
jgi:hypothetical protein